MKIKYSIKYDNRNIISLDSHEDVLNTIELLLKSEEFSDSEKFMIHCTEGSLFSLERFKKRVKDIEIMQKMTSFLKNGSFNIKFGDSKIYAKFVEMDDYDITFTFTVLGEEKTITIPYFNHLIKRQIHISHYSIEFLENDKEDMSLSIYL